MKKGFLAIVLVCCAVAGLPAQPADGRLPMTGSVVDRAGQPWRGATVSVIARPIPEYPHLEDADEIRATTADDGTFIDRGHRPRRHCAGADVVVLGRGR